jgi:hypothetical protein
MGELIDDTTPAAVLARQVRDQILFYPESHQQDVLAIGEVVEEVELGGRYLGHQMDVIRPTKGCVAGWACHLNGDRLVVPQRDHDYASDESDRQSWDAYMRLTYPDDGPARAAAVAAPGVGSRITAWDRASDLLGLEREERTWLFANERTREEVLRALDFLAKGDKAAFRNVVNRDSNAEASR